MPDVFMIDDSRYTMASGRYVVFDDEGGFVAQGDDLEGVMATAKNKGVAIPALVDLELTQDRVYVF